MKIGEKKSTIQLSSQAIPKRQYQEYMVGTERGADLSTSDLNTYRTILILALQRQNVCWRTGHVYLISCFGHHPQFSPDSEKRVRAKEKKLCAPWQDSNQFPAVIYLANDNHNTPKKNNALNLHNTSRAVFGLLLPVKTFRLSLAQPLTKTSSNRQHRRSGSTTSMVQLGHERLPTFHLFTWHLYLC